MSRQCTICTHPDVNEINQMLISEKSLLQISKKYAISYSSLKRHYENHITRDMTRSVHAEKVANADSLLQKLIEYENDAKRYRDMAEKDGDIELALRAVDRALKCVEIGSKIRGLIQEQTQVNILVNPQWIELRSTIITALEPFPEARRAIIDALP